MFGSLTHKLTLSLLLLLPIAALHAQATSPAPTHDHVDLTGSWQGTLEDEKSLRTILVITKTGKGLAAKLYRIDQGGQPIAASSVSLERSAFKFAIEMIDITFEGTLSSDGNSIVGTWTQDKPLPLTFVRATKETAWEIPAPPPSSKLMAADADPAFDVATIKPNNSGNNQIQRRTINGRDFKIRNGSLGDLIAFAYSIQIKQVVNAPDWLEKNRYDIDAIPDHEGTPSSQQLRVMVQKLLADRFDLKYHHDKKELSAYVLTIGKTGQQLSINTSKGPLPSFGSLPVPGGVSLLVRNGTLSDLTDFLQTLVLDRPVVDRTGLTDRFDLILKFTPDESQFNGHPPKPPASTTESFPSISEAFQQQLGLKLTAEKTPVDVIAIDHVDKPSAN